MRHRIELGRSYVWFDEGRRLVFKVDVSAQSRYGVQLSGVYTPEPFRRQGIATRGMFDACRLLFERGWPRVTLYVNQDNHGARRLYERLGFVYHGEYETVFVRR